MKRYRIDLQLNRSQLDAAAKGASASLNGVAQAATKMASTVQKTLTQTVQAKKLTTDQLAALEQKYLVSEYRGRVQHEAKKQRLGDAEVAKKDRDAAQLAAIEQRFLAREYRDRMAYQARRDRADQVSAAKAARAANKAADAQVNAALRSSREQIGMTDRTGLAMDALTGKVQNLAAAYLGMRAAVGVFRSIQDAANAATDAAIQNAQKTIEARESLQEVATIKGKNAVDNEELAKFVKMRQSSGLTHDEALAFTTETLNAVGTVPESKLSKDERERLVAQGSKLAGRLGGGMAGAKTRGRILGLLPNYAKGKTTAAETVATADAADVILQRGAGDQTTLTNQFQEVLTTLASESLAGLFKNPLKTAGLTALASKFGPERSAQATVQLARGLSAITRFRRGEGVDEAQAETLKQAGINEFDDPQQKAEKLFKFMNNQTQGGTKEAPIAWLQRHGFRNQEEYLAISKFFEQWKNGSWEEIMGQADKAPNAVATEKKFEEFAKSKRFRNRRADANLDAAMIDRGQREEEAVIARKEGQAEITNRGLEESSGFQWGRWAHGIFLGSQQRAKEIAQEQFGLRKRAGELGVKPHRSSPANVLFGIDSATGVNQQEARQLDIEAQAQQIQKERAEKAAAGAGQQAAPNAGAIGPQAMNVPLSPMGGIRSMMGAAMLGGLPPMEPKAIGLLGDQTGANTAEMVRLLREQNALLKESISIRGAALKQQAIAPRALPPARGPMAAGAGRP